MASAISIAFNKREMEEIYYALESKVKAVQNGDYAPEDKPGDDQRWIADMKRIMKKIERHYDV